MKWNNNCFVWFNPNHQISTCIYVYRRCQKNNMNMSIQYISFSIICMHMYIYICTCMHVCERERNDIHTPNIISQPGFPPQYGVLQIKVIRPSPGPCSKAIGSLVAYMSTPPGEGRFVAGSYSKTASARSNHGEAVALKGYICVSNSMTIADAFAERQRP